MPVFDVNIRGKQYEIDAPDEQQAAAAAHAYSQQPQHFELGQAPGDDPANLPAGYDPASGEVKHNSAADALGALAGGTLEGVPFAGPALLHGANMGAAGLISATSDKPYDQALREGTSGIKQVMRDNPWSTGAGNVTGAVAGTLPMMVMAPEAFGLGGGSMLAKSLLSAGSGGVIGSGDAAIRSGGDPEATIEGGKWGLGLGLLGPTVGRVVGKGVGAVRDAWNSATAAKLAGMPKAAFQDLVRGMGADDLTGALAQQKLAANPNRMLMDLGPNMEGQAGGIAATPGPGQRVVRDALKARGEGANARLAAGIDTMGPETIPTHVEAEIVAKQEALSPYYKAAIANAKAVDTQALANDLDSIVVNERGAAQSEAAAVRKMLNITGEDVLDPNPATLHATRKAVGGRLRAEKKKIDKDKNVIRVLTDAYKKIDAELAAKVPGIKAIDSKFEDLAKQQEAYDYGQTVLGTAGGNKIRPVELGDKLAEAAQPPRMGTGPSAAPQMMRAGTRAKIAEIVGNSKNDIVKMNKLIMDEGDWNREKLALEFGKDKADALFQLLKDEAEFAAVNNNVTKNSESARRLANMADTGSGPFSGLDQYAVGGVGSMPRIAMVKALRSGIKAMSAGKNAVADEARAKALSSNNIDALVQGIAKMGSGPKSDHLAIRRAVHAALLAPATGPR